MPTTRAETRWREWEICPGWKGAPQEDLVCHSVQKADTKISAKKSCNRTAQSKNILQYD